ncbi:MAG TPA: Xaa-Pro peptidase family protein [Streptosporangiaceae bacterium]|nr:Xaa-Pro peptidase family protein [Streptosporangiaceae bacterium]
MPIEPNFNELLAVAKKAQVVETDGPQPPWAEFPVAEYEARYAKAIALMDFLDLDALLITQEENVRYFSGYLSILWCSKFRPYVVILPRDRAAGPALILPKQETGNGTGTSWIADQRYYPDQDDPIPYVLDALADKGLARPKVAIGAELGFGVRLGMSHEQLSYLRTGLPGQITDGTAAIQTCRMIKSPGEVAKLRRACEISQIGTQAGFSALRPGMTEKELMAIVCSAMYAAGAEPGTRPSFFGCTTGGDYTMVNGLAKNYALQEGDLVMIDGGAVFEGYATDYIRQAAVGGAVTREQLDYYSIALEANNAAITAIKPGVTGADVYEAGMAVFKSQGVYDFNQLTIVGHGVGMDVHEVPWLGERDTVYTSGTVLEPGMVVCIEPVFAGYNDPDWKKGIWIQEDKVLVTDSGPEILTTDISKELWVQAS